MAKRVYYYGCAEASLTTATRGTRLRLNVSRLVPVKFRWDFLFGRLIR